MSSGSWNNTDGLGLFFGTSKATPETGGEFSMPGEWRVAEVDLNLGNLGTSTANATTPVIVSQTYLFPAGQGIQIDKLEVENETVTTPTTATLSIGLVQDDRTTAASAGGATSFLAAFSLTTAGFTTAGSINTFTAGTASAGTLIGTYNTQWNTNTSGTNSAGGYITANLGAASSATGLVRVRIFYHGVGTITN